jgi:hypothetical protein
MLTGSFSTYAAVCCMLYLHTCVAATTAKHLRIIKEQLLANVNVTLRPHADTMIAVHH